MGTRAFQLEVLGSNPECDGGYAPMMGLYFPNTRMTE